VSYYASIETVFALNPDGTERWRYAGTQSVHVGPEVGPRGRVFVASDLSLGAFALSPSGTPVWNNPGNPAMFQWGGSGAEMVFGRTSPAGRIDSFYVAMDRYMEGRLYGFTLSGQQRFAVPIGSQESPFRQQQIQPAVGPDGTVYVTHFKPVVGWGIEAFRPQDGQSLWYHNVGMDLSPPEVGPDGIVYLATIGAVSAFDPATQQFLWQHSDGTIPGHPTVSPLNDMLVMSGVQTFGMPGYVKAIDHAGQPLWKVRLPGRPYPAPRVVGVHRPRFTPDGTVAYLSTIILSPDPGDPHSFLYAIATAEVP
jgi:outer membrane protein assembly factor BamB